MSKILNRIQLIRDKANQLKQAVDAAPAKAAQLRDAVNATAGQLRQLRTDVQDTVTSLHADTDNSLAETLVELDGATGTLERAGYALTGIDIEQGNASRVIVHLDQISAARSTPLKTLLAENAGKRTVSAILKALVRAEELEDQVSLGELSFRGLIVHIGPVPVVRLCWRRHGEMIETEERESTQSEAPPVIATGTTTPPLQSFGSSSLYDVPKPAVSPSVPPPSLSPLSVPPATRPATVELPSATLTPTPSRPSIRLSTSPISRPQPPEAGPASATGDWRTDALARFKQMPKLGK